MFFNQIMECIKNSKVFWFVILIMGERGYLLIPNLPLNAGNFFIITFLDFQPKSLGGEIGLA